MEQNKSKTASFISNLFTHWLPVILTTLVGFILLISSLPKSFEMDLFIRQIGDYDIISHPLLTTFGAWCLVITEYTLGTALILNYRPRITIPPAVLLILIFIGATGWAWYTGATDDCSCFGSWVERTPGEAMVEDFFILGALIYSWFFNKTIKKWPFYIKESLIIVALLAGIVVPLLTGTLPDRINRLISGPVEEGKEVFRLDDFSSYDLSTDRYLIVVMATDCSHCRALMEDLIFIGDDDELPPVVALVMNDEEQREDFIDEYELDFGLYQVADDDFWRLLEDGEIPRTILIDNGIIIKKWDFAFPDIESIKSLLK
ncbi:peroxiredoxin family protein [Thermodesulfobacteriota bacterium]